MNAREPILELKAIFKGDDVNQFALSLAALALIAALEAQAPSPAPVASPAPWLPRPVIIIDPRPYLTSPSPSPRSKRHATPHPRATPARRRPAAAPTPETFERLDTSPHASPLPRGTPAS